MFRNLTTQLIKHDKIVTTLHKAKDLRRFAEKMVTITKRPLHSYHLIGQLRRYTTEPVVAEKAMNTFPLRFKERNGGYTRIIRGHVTRKGDRAQMALIEYIDNDKIPSEEQIKKWKEDLIERDRALDKRTLQTKKELTPEELESKQRQERLRKEFEEAQKKLERKELEEDEDQ